ncbi:MAG: hypothetical protein ACI934_001145 [Pseudohongiellaceae bacterium]|jgi:hypothetical protein
MCRTKNWILHLKKAAILPVLIQSATKALKNQGLCRIRGMYLKRDKSSRTQLHARVGAQPGKFQDEGLDITHSIRSLSCVESAALFIVR